MNWEFEVEPLLALFFHATLSFWIYFLVQGLLDWGTGGEGNKVAWSKNRWVKKGIAMTRSLSDVSCIWCFLGLLFHFTFKGPEICLSLPVLSSITVITQQGISGERDGSLCLQRAFTFFTYPTATITLTSRSILNTVHGCCLLPMH